MVTFPDEDRVLVQFRYERLPNYYVYYGKLGHVSRVCKAQLLSGEHEMEEGDEPSGQGRSLPYEGLEAQMDLWGNVLRSPSRRTKSPSWGKEVGEQWSYEGMETCITRGWKGFCTRGLGVGEWYMRVDEVGIILRVLWRTHTLHWGIKTQLIAPLGRRVEVGRRYRTRVG